MEIDVPRLSPSPTRNTCPRRTEEDIIAKWALESFCLGLKISLSPQFRRNCITEDPGKLLCQSINICCRGLGEGPLDLDMHMVL